MTTSELQELLPYLTQREKEELDGLLTPAKSYAEWYAETIPEYYVVPHHVEWLCREVVQRIVDGELKRVIVSMPPQHAKSDTITRRLPVFWGERFPGENILLTGYSQRFAEQQFSLAARNLAAERGVLASNATALDSWKFSSGGSVTVRGVGNPPTGVPRLKLIIADDPIKSREEASSETVRESIWQWWTGSIVQRFWPDTRVVIITTRWHENDLVGRLSADQPGEWTIINLPAIARESDPIGRSEGEALWPAQKPLPFLLSQKREMGEYEFEALFQGHPTPREGSFFKVGQLQIVDTVPIGLCTIRVWDKAASAGKGDYTAGVKMAGPDSAGYFYVLDVRRGQWDTAERDRIIRETAELDGTHVAIYGDQDPGSAGKSDAQAFVRLLAGFTVRTATVSGDKEVRAAPAGAQVNGGNFRLFSGAWNGEFVSELRTFPLGKNDDQVDAFSGGFSVLAGKRRTLKVEVF